METLGDLLARDRRTDSLAVRVDGERSVEYTYGDFITTAWKTANFFSLRGVHHGATVGIVDEPAVPSLLSLFGATQLGAVAQFDPPAGSDAELLVGPGETVREYDLPPGATRVAYHDEPDDPAVEAFGRSVWSENPTNPPETVDPAEPAVRVGQTPYAHEFLIEATREFTDMIEADDTVVIRAPLSMWETVVTGVLAPLSVGATVVFPDNETVGDIAVGGTNVPEETVLLESYE